MSGRVFLDTNIFVYALDRRDTRKQQIANNLIVKTLDMGHGVISFQVVQEFFNVALKRMLVPMTLQSAERYLTVVFVPLLKAHPSLLIVGEALKLQATMQLQWYDALIIASAQNADCSTLYSEDLQHGQRFGNLRVENPFLEVAQ